jgi:ABC-type phosphate transport system permease subunit
MAAERTTPMPGLLRRARVKSSVFSTRWRNRSNSSFGSVAGAASSASQAIFIFIFKEAAPMVPKLDWIQFFTSPRWIPNPAPGNEASFGALALLAGTFSVTFIGLIFAVPIGLGAAVYVSEFATGKVKETLKVVIELLAAIPSIVWGFIGLMVLGPIVKSIFSTPLQPEWRIISRIIVGGLLAAIFVPLGSRFLWNKTTTAVRATISWAAVAVILLGTHFVIQWLGPTLYEPLSTAGATSWSRCTWPT